MSDYDLNNGLNNRVLYRHIQAAYEYVNRLAPVGGNYARLTEIFYDRLQLVLRLPPSSTGQSPTDLDQLGDWTRLAIREQRGEMAIGLADEFQANVDMLQQPDADPSWRYRMDSELWARQINYGLEAYAVYLPIHFFFDSRQFSLSWGVYIYEEGIKQIAAILDRAFSMYYPHLDLVGNPLFLDIAYQMLLRHELTHFRYEVFALNAELLLGRPIYAPYMTNVYAATFPTVECLEEAVANSTVLNSVTVSNLFKKLLPSSPSQTMWKGIVAREVFDRQPACYGNHQFGEGWPVTPTTSNSVRQEAINYLCNQILRGTPTPGTDRIPFYAFPPDNYFLRAEKLVPIHIVSSDATAQSIFRFATPKQRDWERFLRDIGYRQVPGRGKGDHERWEGPRGWGALTIDYIGKELNQRSFISSLQTLGIKKSDFDQYRVSGELPPSLMQRLANHQSTLLST